MPDIVPMLSYEDCGAAADWLVRAFGFEEVERFDEDGDVVHVTLRAGDGLIYLGTPGATYVNPKRLREQCESAARMYEVPWVIDGVWVRVDEVDAHYERAVAEGATPTGPVEDTSHGRLYRVEDLEGHRWMFAQES